MECVRREWSGVKRKFCYNREVAGGCAQGREERRCKGSVTGGNNKVKCMISIVGWEIDILIVSLALQQCSATALSVIQTIGQVC